MKKIVFVALVLFSSLVLLQYVLLRQVISTPASSSTEVEKTEVAKPVNAQMYDAGDFIVVLKDGKYYVYKKNLPPST